MKLLRYTLLSIFLFVPFSLLGQNWTNTLKPEILKNGTGYSAHDQATASVIDFQGNVLVTGYFEGEIAFDTDTLRTAGNRDIFVAKLNKNGYWEWARSAGGSNADYGRGIAVDANGNVFITGYFYTLAKFGEHTISGSTNTDIFVAKLNSSGVWQWAKSAPGYGFNRGNAVDVDPAGNCFVTGGFDGNITIGDIVLTSSGSRDIFVAKYSGDGDVVWAKKAGGSSVDEALAIKYYSSDKMLYLTGGFAGTASFGSDNISSTGGKDVFVAKMDSSGVFQWAAGAGSTSSEDSRSIALDGGGNAVITGYYVKNFSFGAHPLPSPGNEDVFVAKIDKDGSWLWATAAGSNGYEQGYSVTLDNSGNSYVSGYFTGTANFGGTNLVSSGDRNAFLMKLNSSGVIQWAKAISGTTTIDCYTVATATNGISYPIGAFYHNAVFGSDTLYTRGNSDIFVSRISSSGNWSWALGMGGIIGYVNVNSVAALTNGDFYSCGSFFGTIVFGNDTLKSSGDADIFVAKSDRNGNWLWGRKAGGTEPDVANGIAVDHLGNAIITGYFSVTAKFGNFTRVSSGQGEIFIAKVDTNGNWVWVTIAGEDEFDEGKALVTDAAGNIYVTGYFSDKPYFGATRLFSAGRDDVFVAKLNNSGAWQWAVRGGSSQFDVGNSIDIDPSGNLYITGGFENIATFGSHSVTSGGGDDIFIAKLNNSGTWLWAVAAGTNSFQEYGSDVKFSSSGHVYATGTFKGLCLFGGQYLIGAGNSDGFITKLDTAGNWIWSRSIGGPGFDVGKGISVDATGGVMAVGYYSSSATISGTTIQSDASRASYIVRLASDGSVLYAKSDSNSAFSEARAVADIGGGAHVIAGIYYGQVSFGSLEISEAISLDMNSYFAFDGVASPNSVWIVKENTGKSSLISIAASVNPIIGNRYMAVGDAIGVFYTRNSNLYCAGFSIWNGNDMEITVWGDNVETAVKDGMADNEAYTIKQFDAITGDQYVVVPRYESGPDHFVDATTTVISRLPDYPDTSFIPLVIGWNMVSSIFLATNPNMESIFNSIKNHVAIVKDNAGNVYIPEYDVNTIGDWDLTQGYQVYSQKVQTIKVVGTAIEPEDYPIYCNAGWNIISYLRDSPYDAESGFTPLTENDNLIIAKDNAGNVYIPEFDINMIGNLMPMQGYQVYLTNKDTLQYPPNSLDKMSVDYDRHRYDAVYFRPQELYTANNSVLVISLPDIADGSEIAVMTPSGTVAGAAKFKDGIAPVTVWGNDVLDENPKLFDNGDKMNFVLFNSADNKELILNDLVAEGKIATELTYKQNAYLKISRNTALNLNMNASAYPNPAIDYFWLNLEGQFTGAINIELTDLSGKSVLSSIFDKKTSSHSELISFSNLSNGYYILKIEFDGSTISEGIIINK
ncbi:MAG: T9SS type A sorting domain-containing protein [Candidatus Kapabacteria bacterium]|nr:T9SS type A sorting domain-containing protein [Candidatus Kapabacteria bacterium]